MDRPGRESFHMITLDLDSFDLGNEASIGTRFDLLRAFKLAPFNERADEGRSSVLRSFYAEFESIQGRDPCYTPTLQTSHCLLDLKDTMLLSVVHRGARA